MLVTFSRTSQLSVSQALFFFFSATNSIFSLASFFPPFFSFQRDVWVEFLPLSLAVKLWVQERRNSCSDGHWLWPATGEMDWRCKHVGAESFLAWVCVLCPLRRGEESGLRGGRKPRRPGESGQVVGLCRLWAKVNEKEQLRSLFERGGGGALRWGETTAVFPPQR